MLKALSITLLVPIVTMVIGCQRGPTSSLTNDLPFKFNAASIANGKLESDMTFVADSISRTVGLSTSEVKRVTQDGIKMLEMVMIQQMGMGTMFDTLWVEESTFRPIRYRNVMAGTQAIKLNYGADGHITGSFQRDSISTEIDTTVTELLYDAGGFQGIIAALPLEAGFEADIPVFNYLAGKSTANVKVLDSGVMVINGKTFDVWVVGYSPGGGLVAFLSIDKESGQVLRSETEMDAGKHFVYQAK